MVRFKALVSVATVFLLAHVATSAPAISGTKACITPSVRKEWRTLSKKEQLAYTAAIKCLKTKPSQTSGLYAGAKTRYDDYQALHIVSTQNIHFVGQFLPWHRQILNLFEKELKITCGYEGTQPYWDWSLDAVSETAFVNSPVFDDVYGFGGNGAYIADKTNITVTSAVELEGGTGGGCLSTGPFANTTVPMGPGQAFGPSTAYTPHCLRRDLNPSFAVKSLSQEVINFTLTAETFELYDWRVQGLGPTRDGIKTHGGGHFSVGGMVGEMSDMFSSPGDPLFWLHHGKLDLEWNKWQKLDWPARKTAIGGPDTMFAYPWDWFGSVPYTNITLDYVLDFATISGKIQIRDVMDITDGILCYAYK